MAKFLDFKTVMGRLGTHPSQLTIEQSIALFNQTLQLPKNAAIVEFGPDGGRSTVILAAAARNIDGHLYVVTNWSQQPPGAQQYFEKAVKTHRIESVTTIDQALPNEAHLTVIRANQLRPVAGKVLILGDLKSLEGLDVIEKGPGWTLLKAYEEPLKAAPAQPIRVDRMKHDPEESEAEIVG